MRIHDANGDEAGSGHPTLRWHFRDGIRAVRVQVRADAATPLRFVVGSPRTAVLEAAPYAECLVDGAHAYCACRPCWPRSIRAGCRVR